MDMWANDVSEQPAQPFHIISLLCPSEEAWDHWLFKESTAKTDQTAQTGNLIQIHSGYSENRMPLSRC